MRLTARLGRLLLAAACGLLPLQGAWALELEALMRVLGAVKTGEASFTERRHIVELDRVLESSGRLSFAAPDTFVRETLQPRRERLAVAGNLLTVTQGTRTRTMALDASPEAGVLVEAVRGTLTGNRALLERHFTTQLDGSLERWSLELVPRDVRLRGQVARVRVSGQQAQLREVAVHMPDGDRSVMSIEPVSAR